MKRGKDDEKIMGPMFPRLHVNDTEKGGPRAPPRNKMALYEQLSIPSQRFNRTGMMPLSHNNNANFIPPASSSQGNGHERSRLSPVQAPPSRHLVEKPPSHYLDPSASLAQVEQRKKLDEDDFTVPIFVQSKVGQNCSDYNNKMDREKLSPSKRADLSYSKKLQSGINEDPKVGIMGLNVWQNAKQQNEDNRENILACRKLDKTVSYSQLMDNAEGPPKQADASLSSELRVDSSNDFSRSWRAYSRLQPAQGAESQPSCVKGHVISSQLIEANHDSSILLRKSPLEVQRNLDDDINDTESHEEQTCRSLQPNIEDRGDDVSETSMVESVSGIDISPDDVVGIIGQKHFWKARRAIVNQQRVFAVQVFELHRLIEVQRLIAKSPHLLMEDNAYLGKPIKASATKRLSLEYIVKPPANISKHKNESEKLNDKLECSAENTVEKASLSSVQNGSQPLNYRPFAGNPPVTPVPSNANMGPWCFHSSQGHQWLIPVMSPSEGLIYKPYSGPGFAGPVCGGCGPPGSTPVMGNFLPPAYGLPASHHHYQGIGVPTFVTTAGPHGYFPPYGMPVMSPGISGQAGEQMSHLTTQGLQGQLSGAGANFSVPHQNSCNLPGQLLDGETISSFQHQNDLPGQLFGGGANFSVQHENSCNLPGQRSGTVSDVPNMNAPKDSKVQASTSSSLIEKAQGTGSNNAMGGNNVLPLFPTSPATGGLPNGSARCHEHEQPTRVIRVVPRNGRSASEFAARIFRSIQEERKQYDSL